MDLKPLPREHELPMDGGHDVQEHGNGKCSKGISGSNRIAQRAGETSLIAEIPASPIGNVVDPPTGCCPYQIDGVGPPKGLVLSVIIGQRHGTLPAGVIGLARAYPRRGGAFEIGGEQIAFDQGRRLMLGRLCIAIFGGITLGEQLFEGGGDERGEARPRVSRPEYRPTDAGSDKRRKNPRPLCRGPRPRRPPGRWRGPQAAPEPQGLPATLS